MSKYSFQTKLKLLDTINTDVWIKKRNINNKKTYIVKVLILDDLYDKHKILVDGFVKAARDNYKNLKIYFLSKESIFNALRNDEMDKECLSISLVLCDDTFKNKACLDLDNFKKMFRNSTNNSIYLFNTLLASDKITKDLKKLIWKDYLCIINYE